MRIRPEAPIDQLRKNIKFMDEAHIGFDTLGPRELQRLGLVGLATLRLLPVIETEYLSENLDTHPFTLKWLRDAFAEGADARYIASHPEPEAAIQNLNMLGLKYIGRFSSGKIGVIYGINHHTIENRVGRARIRFGESASIDLQVRLFSEGGSLPPLKADARTVKESILARADSAAAAKRVMATMSKKECINAAKGLNAPLIAVSGLLKNTHDFGLTARATQLLKARGIPVRVVEIKHQSGQSAGKTISHYLMPIQFMGLAMVALEANTSLTIRSKNVSQVYGPKVDVLPRSRALRDPEQYPGVGYLCRELGVAVEGPFVKYHVADLLGDDCPVPVFKFKTSYRVRAEDRPALSSYLQERIRILNENASIEARGKHGIGGMAMI